MRFWQRCNQVVERFLEADNNILYVFKLFVKVRCIMSGMEKVNTNEPTTASFDATATEKLQKQTAVKPGSVSLQDVQEMIQEAYQDLGITPTSDLPVLEPGTDIEGNAWLQNEGFVAMIAAKLTALNSDSEAQLAAAKMIVAFAMDVYKAGMDKVKLMHEEAALTYDRGMMQAEITRTKAYASLASAVITVGLYANTMLNYRRATLSANNMPSRSLSRMVWDGTKSAASRVKSGAQSVAARFKGSPAPQSELEVSPMPAQPKPLPNAAGAAGQHDPDLGGAPPPPPANAPPPPPARPPQGVDADAGVPAAPVGGNAPAANAANQQVSVRKVGGGDKPPEGAEGLAIKNTARKPMDSNDMQRINQMDMSYKAFTQAINESITGFITASIEEGIAEKDRDIKLKQAQQAALDTFIETMRAVIDTFKDFNRKAGERIDQYANLANFLQLMSTPYRQG